MCGGGQSGEREGTLGVRATLALGCGARAPRRESFLPILVVWRARVDDGLRAPVGDADTAVLVLVDVRGRIERCAGAARRGEGRGDTRALLPAPHARAGASAVELVLRVTVILRRPLEGIRVWERVGLRVLLVVVRAVVVPEVARVHANSGVAPGAPCNLFPDPADAVRGVLLATTATAEDVTRTAATGGGGSERVFRRRRGCARRERGEIREAAAADGVAATDVSRDLRHRRMGNTPKETE